MNQSALQSKSIVAFAATLLCALALFYYQYIVNQSIFYTMDNTGIWQPYLTYIGHSLAGASLPLWNPYLWCGASQIGMMAPSPVYPLNWLFAALPFSSALALSILVHQFVAGIGAFLLVRKLGWGEIPAWACGSGFALCSLLFSLQANNVLLATTAWFPLAIWACMSLEAQSQKKKYQFTAIFSLCVYALIAPGVPELFTPELALLALFSVYRRFAATAGGANETFWLRITAFFIGILLAAPQLLPAYEWATQSPRALGLPVQEVLRWSANWYDFVSIALPQPLGDRQLLDNPFIPLTASGEVMNPFISSAFLGPTVLTCACWAFCDRTWRERWTVLSILLFFGLLAAGSNIPATPYLVQALHFKLFRYPIKLFSIVTLCLVVAAARGVRSCIDQRCEFFNKAPTGIWILAFFFAITMLLKLALVATFVDQMHFDPALASKAADKISSATVAMSSLGLFTTIFASLLRRRIKAEQAEDNGLPNNATVAAAAMLFVALPAYFFIGQAAYAFHHSAPRDFYDKPSPLTNSIANSGTTRCFNMFLAANAPARFEQNERDFTLRTYDYWRQIMIPVVNVDRRIAYQASTIIGETLEHYAMTAQAFHDHAKGDDSTLAQFCQSSATNSVLQIVNELTLKGVSTKSRTPLDPAYFEPINEWPELNLRMYKVKTPLPRAYFAKQVKWASPHMAVVQFVSHQKASGFNPHELTLLEHNFASEQAANLVSTAGDNDTVAISEDRAEKISIRAQTSSGRYLVLTDTFYPGWEASLDGASTPIYRANALFRAVFVPPGTHEIVFQYKPKSFYVGLTCAGIGALALLLLIALTLRRRRMPDPAQ